MRILFTDPDEFLDEMFVDRQFQTIEDKTVRVIECAEQGHKMIRLSRVACFDVYVEAAYIQLADKFRNVVQFRKFIGSYVTSDAELKVKVEHDAEMIRETIIKNISAAKLKLRSGKINE